MLMLHVPAIACEALTLPVGLGRSGHRVPSVLSANKETKAAISGLLLNSMRSCKQATAQAQRWNYASWKNFATVQASTIRLSDNLLNTLT